MRIVKPVIITLVVGLFATNCLIPAQGAVVAVAIMGGFILAEIQRNNTDKKN